VYDLVDNNPILSHHYENRADVYRQVGGTIEVVSSSKLK
jgi:hypothetical protein